MGETNSSSVVHVGYDISPLKRPRCLIFPSLSVIYQQYRWLSDFAAFTLHLIRIELEIRVDVSWLRKESRDSYDVTPWHGYVSKNFIIMLA
jgi:hypothetical protein